MATSNRMVRTQVYLTGRQRDMLAVIARRAGIKKSELIREAMDRTIELHEPRRGRQVRLPAAGIWKDRTDLPDLRELRESSNRVFDWGIVEHGVRPGSARPAPTPEQEMSASNEFLVDTDVLIDYARGAVAALRFVAEHMDLIVVSAMTVAELYAGVRGGPDDAERQELVDLMAQVRVAPISAGIARVGGLYRRDYGRSHGVSVADALIAATADSCGAVLKTLNTKHFPMFTGLEPAYRK